MTLPNQLTILRIVLTPAALILLLMQSVLAKQLATGLFVIAALTDWYDGHFARKYGYVTSWGKFLDPLADKLLISAMLVGFAILKYIKFSWVIIIVTRDIIITALRGYMMVYGKPLSPKLLAKWKTFTQMGLIFTLFAYLNLEQTEGLKTLVHPAAFLSKLKYVIDQYVLVVVIFTVITGLMYLVDNRKPIAELSRRCFRAVVPFRPGVIAKSDTQSFPSGGAPGGTAKITAPEPERKIPSPQEPSPPDKR